jgi:flavin reductase (DIM6/NTAB) family NADH-FMN oxidoreductase RutF
MNNTPDLKALFKIGYGLYVVTTNDGKKDNGLIVNTVVQVTSTPCRVAVTVNKTNYSHDTIKETGKMNVNCLSTEAPFSVFEDFGFKSGRDTDKFADKTLLRAANGLAYLPKYINAYISLDVVQYVDLGTHGMFICDVTDAEVISDKESMTYSYYHANVKPKPQPAKKKGYVCKICGYVYENDPLPDDFVCPICKHGADDFEKIQ